MASSAIMASDGQQQQPVFHDFLGMSCTDSSAALTATSKNIAGDPPEASSVGASSGHPLICPPSGLSPERQGVRNIGVQLHGQMNSSSMLDRYSGRKRSNSDSGFNGSVGGRKLPIGADSFEGAHLMKIAHNDAKNDILVRQHREEVFLSMQPPKTVSGGSSLSQPPANVRDFVATNLDRIVPANAVPAAKFHPHVNQYTQYGAFADKISSSVYGDSSAGPSLVTQPAADEGSRTGKKGSGIANIVASASGAADRVPTGTAPGCSRQIPGPQTTELEYVSPSSHKVLSSVNRQMTIFYAGQAHVFDDVHPKKADAIMALAGSNGRSWSTTYSSKSSRPASLSEACRMGSDSETSGRKTLSHDLQGRLPSMASAITHGCSRGGQGSSLSAPSTIPGIQDVASDKDVKLATVQADTHENQDKKVV
ncbi:unnamed protein product [Victoria cruziana]